MLGTEAVLAEGRESTPTAPTVAFSPVVAVTHLVGFLVCWLLLARRSWKKSISTHPSPQRPVARNTARHSMSAIVGTAPPLPINPDDWSYLAEGGFHIILRYDGTDPELTGRILRIGKKALGHQKEAAAGAAADPAKPAAAAVPDEAGARRKFERGVLMPLLGEQYVQPGDAVTLSREDIGKIHLRCVDCCMVFCVQNCTTARVGTPTADGFLLLRRSTNRR